MSVCVRVGLWLTIPYLKLHPYCTKRYLQINFQPALFTLSKFLIQIFAVNKSYQMMYLTDFGLENDAIEPENTCF
jgi:hypothetical protein